MNKLIVILLFVFSVIIFANNDVPDNLTQEESKGDILLTYQDGKLYTGSYKSYSNKFLEREISFNKGLTTDIKYYYPNEKILSSHRVLESGKDKIEYDYYLTGLLAEKKVFFGKDSYNTTRYYEDGKTVWSTATYSRNEKNGKVRGYFKNGKLSYEANFKSNKIIGSEKFYYDNGKLAQTSTVEKYKNLHSEEENGMSDATTTIVYYKNGNIASKYNEKYGRSSSERYYENGILLEKSRASGQYFDSDSEKVYDTKGKYIPKLFDDDERGLGYMEGNGSDEYKYSDYRGETVKSTEYFTGITKTFYDPYQRVVRTTEPFLNGKTLGTYRKYYKNGLVAFEEPEMLGGRAGYGKRVGLVRIYYTNGKLYSIGMDYFEWGGTNGTDVEGGRSGDDFTSYHMTGVIEKEVIQDNLHTIRKEYYINGQVKSLNVEYKRESLMSVEYYPEGGKSN